jgi:hypothetical protein
MRDCSDKRLNYERRRDPVCQVEQVIKVAYAKTLICQVAGHDMQKLQIRRTN